MSDDLSLTEDLGGLRSNRKRCPSSRGHHHRAPRLPSRESSAKAHVGCLISGINWLVRGQIASVGEVRMRLLVLTPFFSTLLLARFSQGALGPAKSQAFTSFGAGTKLLLVCLRLECI